MSNTLAALTVIRLDWQNLFANSFSMTDEIRLVKIKKFVLMSGSCQKLNISNMTWQSSLHLAEEATMIMT